MPLFPRVLAALLGVSLALAGGFARAAWQDEVKVLRVGVLGGSDAAYRLATLEPFRVYLQDKTGIPVEIVPAATYDALIDAQAGGQVDYAIYSATAYATAVVKCECVEAFAAPVAADGALGFYSILVARSGDPVADLAGAKGKRLGLGPKDSVAGSIVPRHAFAADDIDLATHFLAVREFPTPEDAVKALLQGEVDLAAAWSSLTGSAALGYSFGTLNRMVAEGTLSMDRIKLVWQSRLIPFGPHALRINLPAELKGILSGAVLSMAREDPEALDAVDRLGFGGGGFATPDASLYALVIELVTPPAESD
ncbi:MAG TPA: phosphate/phosphite/phosphonate ABC transporter substrate-binding protein [Bauldia sp.]|nr:phosphate/phosphite/phosphonate ABC transporter substrate-binding protein [Bauldia sp.]